MISIGAVPYLNGKPLTKYLSERSDIHLISEIPSKLASLLAGKKIAAGLVSLAACFYNNNLKVLPGINISCKGPAISVKLFYKNDLQSIKCVALDKSSITSITLAKIILSEVYGICPEYNTSEPDIDRMLMIYDAAVLIGDPAMRVPVGKYKEIDLGLEWYKLTDLPFVFAVWALNYEMVKPEIIDALWDAKKKGTESFDIIAEEESKIIGIPSELCSRYLKDIMIYDMTEKHIKSMSLFRDKVIEYNVISNPYQISLFLE